MIEQLFELDSSEFNAVHESLGTLLEQLCAFLEGSDVLLRNSSHVLAIFKDLQSALGVLREELLELITSPFNAMKGLLWEHLQRAVRNLVVILRIVHRAIALCLVRKDYLHVAFRSQSSTLKKRCLCSNASQIDILPRLDVVKSIRDKRKLFEELVREDVTGALMNLIKSGNHVAL